MSPAGLAVTGGEVFAEGRVQRADVLIEGGTITRVGLGWTPVPGTDVLDARGAVLLPGLIDVHAHLAVATPDTPSAALALRGAAHALGFLRAGITAVRDVGGSRHVDLALRQAIADGLVPGPRLQCSGEPIVMTGGHGHMLYRIADGVDQVILAVREQLLARADLIKVMCSGGVFEPTESEQWLQYSEAELGALIAEARAQGKPVAAHAHPAAAISRAVRLGVSSIEHGSFVDQEAAQLMAAGGVPLIPTFVVYRVLSRHPGFPGLNQRALEVYEGKFEPFRRALAEGVAWGVGSDFADLFSTPDCLLEEIDILVREVGLPVARVLQAATSGNARIMGLEKEIGVVAPGFHADLALVEGDPLQDLTALRRVRATVVRGTLHEWGPGNPA